MGWWLAATNLTFEKAPSDTSNMVAGVGKTPRKQLTAHERQQILEAVRRERHNRRTQQKEKDAAAAAAAAAKDAAAKDGAPQRSKGKASRKARLVRAATAKAAADVVGAAHEPAATPATAADNTMAASEAAGEVSREVAGAVQEVQSVVEDMVESIIPESSTLPLNPAATPPHPTSHLASAPMPRSRAAGKRPRSVPARTRKRRRGVLQGDSNAKDSSSSGEQFAAASATQVQLPCVVNGDANLMDAGAEECTGLNSEEDPFLQEEQEDEDDSEDNFVDDWDIGDLTDEDSDVEVEELPDSLCSSVARNKKTISQMRADGWEYDPTKFGPDPSYTDLYDGPFGPSDSVLGVADDPLALLFYFMPPKLWTQIAAESNRYHGQSIPLRARTLRSQQRRRGEAMEELGDIRRRLASVADIEPWEILRVVALLIARMLMPIRKGIAAHWSTKQVGALPVNRFNLFMSKHRFFHIMGYLHFSNNKSPQARIDRAWKIRPVVDVLQRTFARGYRAPPVISFDEATLPSRSRYNPTRQFNKDKPHKWGTKVFVAACAKTAYCLRIEIYCGAKTHLQTPVPKDNNTGEAAVLRNMNLLYPPAPASPWRLVVTDRFYTSVKLALELMHRRIYLTGTIQIDRAGYAKGVVTKKEYKTENKKKIMIPPQGTIKLAQNKMFPQITAAMWMDRNPVHMLTTGGSRKTGSVLRRIDGEMQSVPAPQLVRDYHRWMGGVDVHDQLRMQRYSVQLCYKTRKYYKTLFLGLLDMAIVNAFIVYRYHRKVNNRREPKHYAFFETLMEQLLAIDSSEVYEAIENATRAQDRTAASPAPSAQGDTNAAPTVSDPTRADTGHRLEENPDTVDNEQGVKRRHRSCKVCATYKSKPRKFTKYFCPECSTGNRRKYLCHVVREGRQKTCFHIWHDDWSNGNSIPRTLLLDHKTRDRPPPSHPGKKRQRRATSTRDAEDSSGDGNGDEADNEE